MQKNLVKKKNPFYSDLKGISYILDFSNLLLKCCFLFALSWQKIQLINLFFFQVPVSHFAEPTHTFHCLYNYIYTSVWMYILHTQLFPTRQQVTKNLNQRIPINQTLKQRRGVGGPRRKGEMTGKVKGQELGRNWRQEANIDTHWVPLVYTLPLGFLTGFHVFNLGPAPIFYTAA